MSCTLVYKDQEFSSPEELQKYGEDNDIPEIKEAFDDAKNHPLYNSYDSMGVRDDQLSKEEIDQMSRDADTYKGSIDNTPKLPGDPEINKTLTNFLNKRGWSIDVVDDIRDSLGKKLNVVAKADTLSRLIEVVEGRANESTLPEEASHAAINMIGDDSPLMKSMLDKITGYSFYKDVLDESKSKQAYRNEDGSLNLVKIKKEAMGKLVSDYILAGNEGGESTNNIRDARVWWEKVLDYIRNIFSKNPENPFKEISDAIMKNDPENIFKEGMKDEGEYYQTDKSLDDLEKDQDRIKLDNTIDTRTGQKRHAYTYDGTPVKGSVTETYVDPYLKRLFKGYNFTDKEKETNLLKADVGDVAHEEINNIVKSWTDEDGLLKEKQSQHNIITSPEIYKKLNDYIQSVMAQFPEGTIFKTEQKVFDKKNNVAGSIDFIAITPDGHWNILDWKTQEIFKGQEDLKPHKPETYRIQLEAYKRILHDQYRVKDFDMVRAIPMKVDFEYTDKTLTGVNGIEIGDIDPNKIPDSKNYLLPVSVKSEKTTSEQLDNLLVRLNGIKDNISDKKPLKEELFKKREELAKINNAIRDLQIRGRIERFIDLGQTEFLKYSEKMQQGTLTGKDIWEAKASLSLFSSSSSHLWELSEDLLRAAKESGDPIALGKYKDNKEDLLSMNARTGRLLFELTRPNGYIDQQADNLAKEKGFQRLLSKETPVGNINGIFANLSKITQKSFQTFYKLLTRVQNTADAKFQEDARSLSKLEKGFKEWTAKSGVDWKTGLSKLLGETKDGKWNGNFLAKYKPEFYEKKEEAIKNENKKWLLENLRFDDEKYKEQEAKQIASIKEIKYTSDPEKNEDYINKKITQYKDSHNITLPNGDLNERALYNPTNYFLTANEDWYTNKWVQLNKPENTPLKEAYDFFMERNKEAESLGMIDGNTPWFLPSIYATKVDQIAFGNYGKTFENNFFKNLEVDAGNQYSPEIRASDGTVIERIPSYFKKDMGKESSDGSLDYSDKSMDLFKVYGIYSRHMRNYEAMQDLEDSALLLTEVERNKGSLLTDWKGDVIIKNGEVQSINSNDRNAKLLEGFVKFYLYDKRTGWGADTVFSLPFSDKVYSLQKTWSSVLQYTGLKTRALNPFSGTAAFVGGTSNALFQARKGIFFTSGDWAHALYGVVSNKTIRAAVKYADINLEDSKSHIISELALHGLSRNLSIDKAYIMQQYSYAGVENIIAAAMMRTHMLDENNKIVDINKYVKAKYDYNNTFFDLPKDQRNTIMSKIDAEVKDLKESRSLLKIGGLNSDGDFAIQGISKMDDTFSDFRNKVKGVIKNVLGNIGSNDISSIRTTLLGMTLMQYRSWIPDTIAERFAGYQYNPELDTHTMGKANLFFSELFSKRMPQLAKALVVGFGDNAIKAANDRYNIMKGKAYEQGKEFNITRGEFTDLYIGNIKSQMSELITLMGFAACTLSVVGGGKSPDDTDFNGIKKYLNRGLKRYYTDMAFYYNPLEFTKLIKNPVPAIGLAEDFMKFTNALAAKGFGEVTGNQKIIDSAKPAKYFFNLVPVAHQLMLLIAAQDDDFRKEWGIKVDTP